MTFHGLDLPFAAIKENDDKTFTLVIDKTKVTAADVGSTRLQINLQDSETLMVTRSFIDIVVKYNIYDAPAENTIKLEEIKPAEVFIPVEEVQ